MIISRDDYGLYGTAGRYYIRPYTDTQFSEGDEVKSYHFGGSIFSGVGKDASCKRGQYLEYWHNCGVADEPHDPGEIAWYRTRAWLPTPYRRKKWLDLQVPEPDDETRRRGEEWMDAYCRKKRDDLCRAQMKERG